MSDFTLTTEYPLGLSSQLWKRVPQVSNYSPLTVHASSLHQTPVFLPGGGGVPSLLRKGGGAGCLLDIHLCATQKCAGSYALRGNSQPQQFMSLLMLLYTLHKVPADWIPATLTNVSLYWLSSLPVSFFLIPLFCLL